MKFTIGLVAFAAFAEAQHFKSGAVTGFEKFTYGKFITRMKAPNKKGTVASFFTYWNGPNFFPGGWNELDVEIVPSVSQNPFSMNVIYGDGHTKHEAHDYKGGFDPKNDWHIYEIAWTPDFIAWSIDQKEVRRINKTDPSVKLTSKPQSVMMNFWTPTFESWGKGLDAADMPWEVNYDYVETYTYNTHTKGFDFHWRDEFNTFDTNRWHKSDNTTFDANSTTFRASQSFIKDGALVLKMEPDHPEDVHGLHRFELPEVKPVKTQPMPHHADGKKSKEGDDHHDLDVQLHHAAMERAYDTAAHGMPYGPMPYGPGPYGPYPGYGYNYGHQMYGQHADPFAGDYYGHLTGHDYPYHHADEHHQQKKADKKGAKQNDANFATGDHLGDEVTPFEHEHHDEPHHDRGYAHGYHYGGHHGDHRDYSADHDSTYAFSHVPPYAHAGHDHDDWHTGYVAGHHGDHHEGHHVAGHLPAGIDYGEDPHEVYNEHDHDYTHDADYNDGHRLMGQIEREYDELFHELEHNTEHGVEHKDVSYLEHSLIDAEKYPQHPVQDFSAVNLDHETIDQGHAGHHDGHHYDGAYAHGYHGEYVAAHHDAHYAPAHGYYGEHHGDWNVHGYGHGEHGYAHGDHTEHHGDWNVHGYGHGYQHGEHHGEHHGDWNVHGDHGVYGVHGEHHGELHGEHHPEIVHPADDYYSDSHLADFGHGPAGHEPHNEHDQDYTHDTDYHGGHKLMGQIEREYDELFHELEARTEHGVEHKDISFVERTLTDHDHVPQVPMQDFSAVPTHDSYYAHHAEGHHDTHHGDDHHYNPHHGSAYEVRHHEVPTTHHVPEHHAAPVHHEGHHDTHHAAPVHHEKKAVAPKKDKKADKPASKKEEVKEVAKKLYYSDHPVYAHAAPVHH